MSASLQAQAWCQREIDAWVKTVAMLAPAFPSGGEGSGLTQCDMHEDESY